MKPTKEPEISIVTELIAYTEGRRAVRLKDKNSGIFIEKMLNGGESVRAQTQNMTAELRRAVIDYLRLCS